MNVAWRYLCTGCLFFRLKCIKSYLNKVRMKLSDLREVLRAVDLILSVPLQPMGGGGTCCQIVFCLRNVLRQLTFPTSGGKGIFILQRANQNILYYFRDASNPWCGLEFSFPQKLEGDMVNIFNIHGHVQANIE